MIDNPNGKFSVRIAFNEWISHCILVRADTELEAQDRAYYHRLVRDVGWFVVPRSAKRRRCQFNYDRDKVKV